MSLILIGVALSGAADHAKPGPAITAELQKLQGTWQVVRVESAGKVLPSDMTKDWTLKIEGSSYTMREGDRTIQGDYKLGALTSPRAIDAIRTSGTDKGKTLWGIYEIEGDRLVMCFTEPNGHERPKQFTTAGKDGGQSLYVLKRTPKR
jgi:uncharacterized protein (TIGR03067 family)